MMGAYLTMLYDWATHAAAQQFPFCFHKGGMYQGIEFHGFSDKADFSLSFALRGICSGKEVGSLQSTRFRESGCYVYITLIMIRSEVTRFKPFFWIRDVMLYDNVV